MLLIITHHLFYLLFFYLITLLKKMLLIVKSSRIDVLLHESDRIQLLVVVYSNFFQHRDTLGVDQKHLSMSGAVCNRMRAVFWSHQLHRYSGHLCIVGSLRAVEAKTIVIDFTTDLIEEKGTPSKVKID